MKLVSLLSLTFLAPLACTTAAQDPTSAAESPISDTVFQAGLREGTDDARLILAVLNDRGLSADDYVKLVKISRVTADALVATRDGVNGRPESRSIDVDSVEHWVLGGDDEHFQQLHHFDALPGTDAGAFRAVLEFARAKGYRPFELLVALNLSRPTESTEFEEYFLGRRVEPKVPARFRLTLAAGMAARLSLSGLAINHRQVSVTYGSGPVIVPTITQATFWIRNDGTNTQTYDVLVRSDDPAEGIGYSVWAPDLTTNGFACLAGNPCVNGDGQKGTCNAWVEAYYLEGDKVGWCEANP
jgi:hypothetical protein